MKQLLSIFILSTSVVFAQNVMTPEKLITLNRLGTLGLSSDKENVIYSISKVDLNMNSSSKKYYQLTLDGETQYELKSLDGVLPNSDLSTSGAYRLLVEEVKVESIYGTDLYPKMKQSNMMRYDDLNYRHWDTWEDGKYSHLIIENVKTGEQTDILQGLPFDCPQKPFGGAEDYTWHPTEDAVYYVCKKKSGKEYAVSTNTDIYRYDISSGKHSNLTESNKGYDTNPIFSPDQKTLGYLSMKRDGYESDKNDLKIISEGKTYNLTADWDNTVREFMWSEDGKSIFLTAAVQGTVHLFELKLPKIKNGEMSGLTTPIQLTAGQFDIRGIVGQNAKTLILARGDMNQATELYNFSLKSKEMKQITHANDKLYGSLDLGKVEKRITKTVDGKDLHSWVIYPPNFDPNKKYPTLLYCQGGPQGALSQFYSYRWNFQLMAAHGYIVIAPNRRGMPGYGVEWNEQISKDYGGLNMQDYLAAIDDLAKEDYVDNNRLGCVGASYGGYSAFYLAAIHEGRFKTFIAHDGIFNWKSMYGTTEELFFVNFDIGGPYWDKSNTLAQKGYNEFNPVEHVDKWDTPILVIQGGKDFRVPIGQGLEAFQAAQLKGLKSRLLFFPEENHWVLDYQNSFIWHTEFYKWLKETL